MSAQSVTLCCLPFIMTSKPWQLDIKVPDYPGQEEVLNEEEVKKAFTKAERLLLNAAQKTREALKYLSALGALDDHLPREFIDIWEKADNQAKEAKKQGDKAKQATHAQFARRAKNCSQLAKMMVHVSQQAKKNNWLLDGFHRHNGRLLEKRGYYSEGKPKEGVDEDHDDNDEEGDGSEH